MCDIRRKVLHFELHVGLPAGAHSGWNKIGFSCSQRSWADIQFVHATFSWRNSKGIQHNLAACWEGMSCMESCQCMMPALAQALCCCFSTCFAEQHLGGQKAGADGCDWCTPVTNTQTHQIQVQRMWQGKLTSSSSLACSFLPRRSRVRPSSTLWIKRAGAKETAVW